MSTTTIWVDDDGREAHVTLADDGSYHVAPEALAHLMRRAGLWKVGDTSAGRPAPPPAVHTVSVRGVLLAPTPGAARRRHECAWPGTGGQLEGSTWDCPECGTVWIAKVYRRGDTIFRPISLEWVRAARREARAHRRRVAAGEGLL